MAVKLTKRTFMEGGLGLTIANLMPFSPFTQAFAQATPEQRVIDAAKPLGATDLSGIIWSNYLVPMKPVIEEFKKATGIGVGNVQDITIFDTPQRAMAEALSRSPQFDFI